MAKFDASDLQRLADDIPRSSQAVAAPLQNKNLTQLAETLDNRTSGSALSPVVISGAVRMLEFVLIGCTGTLIHFLYQPGVHPLDYFYAIAMIDLLALVIFQAMHLNDIPALRAPVRSGLKLLACWTLVFLASQALVFLWKAEGIYSRVWLVSFFGIGFGLLMIERGIIAIIVRHLTRGGRLDRRTAIVGGGPSCDLLLQALTRQVDSDLQICGVFDDRADDRSPDLVAGFPKLGNVDDLVEFARHTRIDLIIFTVPITAETRLLQMLRKLWVLPIDIRLSAHTNKLRFRPRSYSYIGNVPVLDVFDKPIADWDVVLKTAFDRIVGALALLVLSPVLLAVALAVKLDSRGPVFFRQKRHGFNNEPIDVWKFRSMYTDKLEYTSPTQATRNDPRVTRVGRFIRRASLDELPQLFNVVFFGNLSLIGPRPHPVNARTPDNTFEAVVDGYFARHRVKPGITGWAQVNGWRGETDTPEKLQNRVEHDLYYIENWSIFFDIYILAITPFALINTENAF
ncbi:MAG: undecaprenyl-phosphate glucose phosphotransferase [Hyphomicrobiales bacterium]|nr:undecaprenyl-phosphate glucose phosphotransferase [Hyphomicrobiales bacterium]